MSFRPKILFEAVNASKGTSGILIDLWTTKQFTKQDREIFLLVRFRSVPFVVVPAGPCPSIVRVYQ